jgi:hypothetical protein
MSFFHGLNPTDISSGVHNPFIQRRPELKDMKQQQVLAQNWKALIETEMGFLDRAANIIYLTFDSIFGDHFLPIDRIITAHYRRPGRSSLRDFMHLKDFARLYPLGDLPQSYKGLLDYLIFPLIARKLFGNRIEEYYAENPAQGFASLPLGDIMFSTLFSRNFLVFFIVLPLEVTRFTAAVAFTLLLAPLAAIVCGLQLLGNALCSHDAREEVSLAPSP